jgi:hypothetical protein
MSTKKDMMDRGAPQRLAISALVIAAWLASSASVWAQLPTAAKVFVQQEGFHRVSLASLTNVFGLTESQLAATALKVSQAGREVTSVRDGGDLVFYAHRYESIYTDLNVYWVRIGQPQAVPERAALAANPPYAVSFPAKVHREDETLLRADLMIDETDDAFYWRLMTSGLSTRTYTAVLSVPAIAVGTASITVRLKGGTDTLPSRYYHRATIELNGSVIGTVDFEGFNPVVATFPVSSSQLLSGNNNVKITSTPPPGTSFDSILLDYVTIDYQRTFASAADGLTLPVGSLPVQVTGLTSANLRVWDVTDLWVADRITGVAVNQAGGTWTASLSSDPGRYAVGIIGTEKTPVRVTAASTLDLRATTWSLDHLTIASTGLIASAQGLATYRAGQGLQAAAVTVDDIYDNFNFGIRDGRAMARFLGYAYRNWTKSPRYIAMVGDGSLDYRNFLNKNDSDLPTEPVIDIDGLYASDYAMGDIDRDGYLEMAVGRIPVANAAQMNDYLAKLAAYESGGNWQTNTLISTDSRDQAGIYIEDGNYLSGYIADRQIERADIEVLGTTGTREKLINGMNDGQELTVYIGHGSANQIAQNTIMSTSDTTLLTNSASPTVFMALGCLVGTFGSPGSDSIGEGMIKAKGGAVGLIAASTFVYSSDGVILAEDFLDTVYQSGADRLGEAWIAGKNRMTDFGRYWAFEGFQLLGDPAIALGNPNAPRDDIPQGPGRGTYEEWQGWTLAPVLEDLEGSLDPAADLDGDGFSNYGEYMAGTDAFDSGSKLIVANLKRLSNGDRQIEWPSVAGRTYTIEAANSLTGGFSIMASGLPATAPINQLPITGPASELQYFRIVVE